MNILPSVPSSVDLNIKATASGAVYLKEGRFRSRYTGNKFSAVDINGKLWLKAADLKKAIRGNEPKPKKKKARMEMQAVEKISSVIPQISENLPTLQTGLSTNETDLLTVSPRTYKVNKKEVRQRILGYLNTQKGAKELYFWTVTFPPGITDALAYRAYNTWLTRLRQEKMLREYIWVAERQGNGTVHFHIAIPHFMKVQRANMFMAVTLRTMAKAGDIPISVYACKRYNGVDIAKNRKNGQPHKVLNFAGNKKGARALTGYLTKYLTKNNTEFLHLAWHNSRGYSSIFTGVTFTIDEFRRNGMYSKIDPSKRFENEFFVFVPWWGEPPKKLTAHLFELNSGLQMMIEGNGSLEINTLCLPALNNNTHFMRQNEVEKLSVLPEYDPETFFRVTLERLVPGYAYTDEYFEKCMCMFWDAAGMYPDNYFRELHGLMLQADADGHFFLKFQYLTWAVDLFNQLQSL